MLIIVPHSEIYVKRFFTKFKRSSGNAPPFFIGFKWKANLQAAGLTEIPIYSEGRCRKFRK
jgi:hypothetical protein